MAKYVLSGITKIFAAKYKLVLPSIQNLQAKIQALMAELSFTGKKRDKKISVDSIY